MSRINSFLQVPPSNEFPLNNVPVGMAKFRGRSEKFACTRIGDFVIRLDVLESSGLLRLPLTADDSVFATSSLKAFVSSGPAVWQHFRSSIQGIFGEGSSLAGDDRVSHCVRPVSDVDITMPMEIGAFTDFYSSKHHAANLGRILRGNDNPLQPNWLHLPVAYDARASSVVVSGTPLRRPRGQIRPTPEASPEFAPTRKLDAELELGAIIGIANSLGAPVPIEKSLSHVFGFVLLNDWSARDIQSWEYQPLGPFLGKSFCTTISPWIIMTEALDPFRRPVGVQEPQPLPYLFTRPDYLFDIELEMGLKTPTMNDFEAVCQTNALNLYWTIAQQIAHHTSNGCNLQVGDLLGSGTISGTEQGQLGSFMENSWNGTRDVMLTNGERRRFLLDGDEVRLSGRCRGSDYIIGFGDASGKLLAPIEPVGS